MILNKSHYYNREKENRIPDLKMQLEIKEQTIQ
jgi:hypothetical protein